MANVKAQQEQKQQYLIEGNNTVKANIDGTIFIPPTGFAGTVESVHVGGLGIDVLAGSKAFLQRNYTILYRSINSGTYTIAVASNVITIDGNISATQ